MYEPAEMQRLGFTYRGMGRASGNAALGMPNGNGAAAEVAFSEALPQFKE
jgi:hypothetical protein